MAAERGQAQYCLGYLYAAGHGVPQDSVQAYKWLSLAASRFPTSKEKLVATVDAISNRDEIASEMTPEQLTEAPELVLEWKPK